MLEYVLLVIFDEVEKQGRDEDTSQNLRQKGDNFP